MLQQKVFVTNSIGIHSRPAALLVDTATRFSSAITITHGDKSALATSMIKLLSLKVKKGSEITIRTEGPDEADAIAAIAVLIDSKFGEE